MKHYKNMNDSVFLSDLSKIMILYNFFLMYNLKSAVDQCVGEWITWIMNNLEEQAKEELVFIFLWFEKWELKGWNIAPMN